MASRCLSVSAEFFAPQGQQFVICKWLIGTRHHSPMAQQVAQLGGRMAASGVSSLAPPKDYLLGFPAWPGSACPSPSCQSRVPPVECPLALFTAPWPHGPVPTGSHSRFARRVPRTFCTDCLVGAVFGIFSLKQNEGEGSKSPCAPTLRHWPSGEHNWTALAPVCSVGPPGCCFIPGCVVAAVRRQVCRL